MMLTKKQLRMLNVIKAQTRSGATVTTGTVASALRVSKSSAQAMMWHLAYLCMLERPTVTMTGTWRVMPEGDAELRAAGNLD